MPKRRARKRGARLQRLDPAMLKEMFKGRPTEKFAKKRAGSYYLGSVEVYKYAGKLSREETFELVRRARAGDAAALEIVTEHNLGLAASLARKHAGVGQEYGLSVADLFQQGWIGLAKGAYKFNLKKYGHLSFSTYVRYWIMQEIVRSIHEKGPAVQMGTNLSEIAPKVYRARTKLISQTGREPTAKEIAKETKLTPTRVRNVIAASKISMHSLSANILGRRPEKGEGLALEEMIGDPKTRVEDQATSETEKREQRELLKSLLATVTDERYRVVALLRYGFNGQDPVTGKDLPIIKGKPTLKRVAAAVAQYDEQGVVRVKETIRQYEKRALGTMRRNARRLGLEADIIASLRG